MKPRCSNQRNHALTLMELFVVIAIVAVLVSLLVPKLAEAKKKAQRISCVSNLMQIGLGFRIWGGDHTNFYPLSLSTNSGGTKEYISSGEVFRHFQVMSNELGVPLILVCPADTRHSAKDFASIPGNQGVSYFVGLDADETKPQMPLSGDRNIIGGTRFTNGIVEFSTNQTVRWSSEIHDGVGNIGLNDGSVQQLTTIGLTELLQQTGLATNRLAIP
jgi:hypothetical protein